MLVHFLNVGDTRYGDCVLVQKGKRTLLVDGAHSKDFKSHAGLARSIPGQLQALLGPPPFKISLLIVTHCHSDHIGCLPAMVAAGLLKVDDALVADEKLGFGRALPDGTDDILLDRLPAEVRQLLAALREEPRGADESDEALAEFLADADNLEADYGRMLVALAQAGTKLVRYTGQPLPALEKKYKTLGLRILGPTKSHLEICANAIGRYAHDALELIGGLAGDRPELDAVSLYRSALVSGLSDAPDLPGKGAALNDQSIVVSLGAGKKKVLLAGDMQFANPEVGGLAAPMTALLKAVKQGGPYALIKTSHHTAANGLTKAVLADYAGQPFLVHSGGSADPGHPNAGSLQALRASTTIAGFARTDRNGLISVDLHGPTLAIANESGALNDFTPNNADPVTPAAPAIPAVAPTPPVAPRTEPLAPVQVRSSDGMVEVIARIPNRPTKVTVTVQIEPAAAAGKVAGGTVAVAAPIVTVVETPGQPDPAVSLAGGRSLPHLLFATSRAGLNRIVGAEETEAILSSLAALGHTVVDSLPDRQPDPAIALATVKQALRQQKPGGVVLLGGYDVVPAVRLDALSADLRAQLPHPSGDADNFIVWSDAEYGDTDDDVMPELPVSRVPDGGSADFLRRLLAGVPVVGAVRSFGIRNRERPFAELIFQGLPAGQLLVSEPTGPDDITPAALAANHLYFMLHGSDRDTSRFWGEDNGGAFEAINVGNLQSPLGGIVLAGCCWGALIGEQAALYQRTDQPAQPKAIDESMALSCLAAGASAFIGCTGSHYSPTVAPYGYFGGPLHAAFWREIQAGRGPAEALFNAKVEYSRGMPHGRTHAIETAIEMKLYHQFTCLGLGW